jgi:hypothetical protein
MRVKAVVAIVAQHKDAPFWHKLHKFIMLAYSLKIDHFERQTGGEILMSDCDTVLILD